MSTGASVYVKYGWESTFKDGASTKDKTFGWNTRVTTLSLNHNIDRLFALGSREAKKFVFKRFEGSFTAEFVLGNPWFLKGVFGTVNTSGSSPPYTHSYSIATNIPSLGVEVGYGLSGGNVVRTLKGVIVNGLTVTTAIDEFANVRLEGVFADHSVGGTLGSGIDESFEPFTFANGSLELPQGTVLANVQNAELTIVNNHGLLYGLGDYLATGKFARAVEISGRIGIVMKDSSLLSYVANRSEVATLRLKFTNGLTGANERTIRFDISGVGLGEHGQGLEPNELVLEDIPFVGRSITATAINSTGTHP